MTDERPNGAAHLHVLLVERWSKEDARCASRIERCKSALWKLTLGQVHSFDRGQGLDSNQRLSGYEPDGVPFPYPDTD